MARGEMIPVRCVRDGQIEWANRWNVRRRQKLGFKPYSYCGFCGRALTYDEVPACECETDMFLHPGEECAMCGRPYDRAIDNDMSQEDSNV